MTPPEVGIQWDIGPVSLILSNNFPENLAYGYCYNLSLTNSYQWVIIWMSCLCSLNYFDLLLSLQRMMFFYCKLKNSDDDTDFVGYKKDRQGDK